MDYNNHNHNYNNTDYSIPQNAGYYQNNVGGYSKNGYDNNSYSRGPQNHLEHVNNNRRPPVNHPPVNHPSVNHPPVNHPSVNHPPVNHPPVNHPPVNHPPVNYINNGGTYPDPMNGYNNPDPYNPNPDPYNPDPYNPNIKSTSPGGSAYGGDSGYSDPHNISSHSNYHYKNQNPHKAPITNRSYNTPYPPSPKQPSSPVMPGMNLTYPKINPIPAYQTPGGHQTDTYNEKENYSSMPSGPTNYGQEKPTSPSSAYSKKPFLEEDDDDYDEKKQAKPGGLMKYCCCGRRITCCRACAIICCILILLIIGIVVAVLLWARKPNIEFLDIVPSPDNLPSYSASPDGFDFNFGLRIQVDNPNFIGAKFERIKAVAFYPNHTDPIGGGNITNLVIAAKGNTTFDFPFSVNYNKDIDPGFAILFDIAERCGLTGKPPRKLEINYTLTLTFKVLLITINPSLDRKAYIDCPIKDGKIPNIPGFDIDKAAETFGGGKKRDLSKETKNSMMPNM